MPVGTSARAPGASVTDAAAQRSSPASSSRWYVGSGRSGWSRWTATRTMSGDHTGRLVSGPALAREGDDADATVHEEIDDGRAEHLFPNGHTGHEDVAHRFFSSERIRRRSGG